MGIDLVWLDRDGGHRDEVNDVNDAFSTVILRIREDRSRNDQLLSSIDPYNNTRFMSAQAAQLLRELIAVRDETANVDERIALGHVIAIVRAADAASDDWLEFVGD